MNREEMLEILHSLDYCVVWPGDWNDVGFTEREIWLNSKGYGYFACDEANNSCTKAQRIPDERWNVIRELIKNDALSYGDVQGTSLEKLFIWDYFEDEDLTVALRNMLTLPNPMGDYYYCGNDDFEVIFFDNEGDLKKTFYRDWCDYFWDELEDEELEQWINRINTGEIVSGDYFTYIE